MLNPLGPQVVFPVVGSTVYTSPSELGPTTVDKQAKIQWGLATVVLVAPQWKTQPWYIPPSTPTIEWISTMY